MAKLFCINCGQDAFNATGAVQGTMKVAVYMLFQND
jgi:hypothetical protein